jgi:hypothetical protein
MTDVLQRMILASPIRNYILETWLLWVQSRRQRFTKFLDSTVSLSVSIGILPVFMRLHVQTFDYFILVEFSDPFNSRGYGVIRRRYMRLLTKPRLTVRV